MLKKIFLINNVTLNIILTNMIWGVITFQQKVITWQNPPGNKYWTDKVWGVLGSFLGVHFRAVFFTTILFLTKNNFFDGQTKMNFIILKRKVLSHFIVKFLALKDEIICHLRSFVLNKKVLIEEIIFSTSLSVMLH